ncbi:MAG: hypothetical protein ACI95C_002882 [Pseudohongiellaceae bacterium]|jgi:hypothetical protein
MWLPHYLIVTKKMINLGRNLAEVKNELRFIPKAFNKSNTVEVAYLLSYLKSTT